jgi:hypothetical protein
MASTEQDTTTEARFAAEPRGAKWVVKDTLYGSTVFCHPREKAARNHAGKRNAEAS